MSDAPQIDPNWVRRKRVEEPDYTVGAIALAVAGALALAGIVAVRDHASRTEAIAVAKARAEALSAEARRRRLDEERERFRQVGAVGYAGTSQGGEGTGSSIAGKSIYRCYYRGTESLQTARCVHPWIDMGRSQASSRWESVQAQEAMRRAAEARLDLERRRYAAAIGAGDSASWSQPDSRSTPGYRCERAKAERDEAYRIAGNDRSFNFIRRWNDYVYEACKET